MPTSAALPPSLQGEHLQGELQLSIFRWLGVKGRFQLPSKAAMDREHLFDGRSSRLSHPYQFQLHRCFNGIRQPVEVGLAPRREVDGLRGGKAGPVQQGGERFRCIE